LGSAPRPAQRRGARLRRGLEDGQDGRPPFARRPFGIPPGSASAKSRPRHPPMLALRAARGSGWLRALGCLRLALADRTLCGRRTNGCLRRGLSTPDWDGEGGAYTARAGASSETSDGATAAGGRGRTCRWQAGSWGLGPTATDTSRLDKRSNRLVSGMIALPPDVSGLDLGSKRVTSCKWLKSRTQLA
jgi:hypothetical protein